MRNPKLIAAAAMSAAVVGGAVVGAAVGNPIVSGAQDGATTTTAPQPSTGQPAPDQGSEQGPGRHLGGPGGIGFGFGIGEALEPAAKALGMSVEDLRKELAGGKTLAEVAKEKGVDRDDLADALVDAAKAKLDSLEARLPDLVDKALDAKLPEGGRGGRRGPGGFGVGIEAAAKALGMTTDDLRAELKDGKTLAEVAKDKGVDQQKVIDALVGATKTRLDEAVKDGKITQDQADKRLAAVTERITKQVTEGFGKGGPRGPRQGD